MRASLGPATFLYARSFALEHRVRPLLRIAFDFPVFERFTLGPAIGGVLGTDSNYGVWGAYAAARYELVRQAPLTFAISAGLGVGYDAPILHQDLQTDGSVLPYGELGLDVVWRLGQRWSLGVEAGAVQLTTLHASLALITEL